jgi:hypothetical protein
VPVFCTTSTHVVPSVLICVFSPAPSAVLVPDTVSDVSFVMKSDAEVPLSEAIAVISTVAVGAVVSMVMAWLSMLPPVAGDVHHPRLIREARWRD